MDIWISKRKRTTTLNEEPRFQAINVSQGGRYNNRVDSVVDIIRPRPKKDMTHEISSTTSCTTVTRATTLEKTRRIFKIITLESQKKWPLIIKFQRSLQKSSSKKTRERRDLFHLRLTVSKHFPTSSTSVPIPSQHPLQRWFSRWNFQKTIIVQRKKKKKRSITFLILARRDPPSSIDSFKHFPTSSHFPHNIPSLSALHNSANVFPNVPQHSTCSTKKKKTIPRIHDSILELKPLKSETMNRVTRASSAEEKPGWLTWLPGGQRGGVAGQEGAFTRVQGSGKRR